MIKKCAKELKGYLVKEDVYMTITHMKGVQIYVIRNYKL